MNKHIKISIDKMGNTKVEAEGFMGIGCTDATAAIEMALAAGPGDLTRDYKDSYHQNDGVVQEQQIGW